MEPSPAPKLREAIYVPPRPNPGPVSIEVPVSNAMTVAVGLAISVCAGLLLATRSRTRQRTAPVPEPARSVRTAEARIADAVREVREAASSIDPARLSQSRTTEELAADPDVPRLMGEESGGRLLAFLTHCDRARFRWELPDEDVTRLEAWSLELASALRRRDGAGARSRIKGK